MARDDSVEVVAGVTCSSSVLYTSDGEDSVEVAIRDEMGVVGGFVLVMDEREVSDSESSQCW
ncbi:hypothetical protein BpHYR1_042414 [Brachionus plicatilis]|uniref:Uncharacterized protein n=1 Tax=Brachionus plicatilis TaxID=10195 RepID=A0A3M7QKB3_BRAPC|nr:hypothetical protein BpHYR1_042414 [Brachionus plicatilis]